MSTPTNAAWKTSPPRRAWPIRRPTGRAAKISILSSGHRIHGRDAVEGQPVGSDRAARLQGISPTDTTSSVRITASLADSSVRGDASGFWRCAEIAPAAGASGRADPIGSTATRSPTDRPATSPVDLHDELRIVARPGADRAPEPGVKARPEMPSTSHIRLTITGQAIWRRQIRREGGQICRCFATKTSVVSPPARGRRSTSVPYHWRKTVSALFGMSHSVLSLAASFFGAAISASSARCCPLGRKAVAGVEAASRIQRRSALSASSRSPARLRNRNTPLGHRLDRLDPDLLNFRQVTSSLVTALSPCPRYRQQARVEDAAGVGGGVDPRRASAGLDRRLVLVAIVRDRARRAAVVHHLRKVVQSVRSGLPVQLPGPSMPNRRPPIVFASVPKHVMSSPPTWSCRAGTFGRAHSGPILRSSAQ